MNKVMTRAQHRSGTRPPARHDSRRPAGGPPRTPGGSTTRTSPGDGRPPGSPGNGARPRTRPTDSRPQGTPTRAATSPTTRLTATPDMASDAAPDVRSDVSSDRIPLVPPQTPRRPHVPVPRPRPTDLFADLLLAVLSGQRPVHSMLRHTAGRAYDELAWLAERGPLRTRGSRPVVRDIGYYVPRQGAVEAFARIGAGDQLRAMAFRLEQGQDLRWRCTAVELGGPRAPRPDDD
ncbi:Rv3235 family protein [Streptomyces sp. 351MFTsu5.1]|uniref:Rv3235 family protein n=1 Tax=Streptomyces sp. 351MFTsu5.1 TaxID=1172180 RepID=UPI000371F8BF|nr:Rv3235 family protein [Streptomyces sp. 351MFTsu5.1]